MRLIGIGHDWRGDDAAGLLLLRALQHRAAAGWQLCAANGECGELLTLCEDAAAVLVVDTARAALPPGSLLRLDALSAVLPSTATVSTHAGGLAEAIRLGRVLGGLPARLELLAIVGADFTLGAPASVAVRAAVQRLAAGLARGELPAFGLTPPQGVREEA